MPEKKQKKQKKPTRFEALSASVAAGYRDHHTATIASRARVLEFEGEEMDRAIVSLKAALADRRDRRRMIDASLAGLRTVTERR